MNGAAILADLAGVGARLAMDGERLKLDAPKGTLAPELVDRIRAAKGELLALLAHPKGMILAGWLEDVSAMRRGDDPDWLAWPPVCRLAWSIAMIDLARAEGFYELAPAPFRIWLEGIAARWAASEREARTLAGASPQTVKTDGKE